MSAHQRLPLWVLPSIRLNAGDAEVRFSWKLCGAGGDNARPFGLSRLFPPGSMQKSVPLERFTRTGGAGAAVPLRAIGSLRKSGGFDCLELDEGSIKGW